MVASRTPLVLLAVCLVACGARGSQKLQGHWRGTKAEGVPSDAQAAANDFASRMRLDVKGDEMVVVTPKDRQVGHYRVVRDSDESVVIVTEQDNSTDEQKFTLEGKDRIRWAVADNKFILFTRE